MDIKPEEEFESRIKYPSAAQGQKTFKWNMRVYPIDDAVANYIDQLESKVRYLKKIYNLSEKHNKKLQVHIDNMSKESDKFVAELESKLAKLRVI